MAASPLTIKLRCASWQQVSALYERDLLRSGLFLKSAAPPPVGTLVRINLTLPTQTLIVLNGAIAQHVGPGGLDGRGPGVDIKLHNVPHSALWLIESALSSARESAPAKPTAPSSRGASAQSARAGASAPADGGVKDADLAGNDHLVRAENQLLEALQSEFESMRKLNPFQVLGVEYDATDSHVRAAFAGMTKRFHPDRYTRYESREAHRLAAEIFILVRNAYQHLDTAAKRAHTHGVLLRRRAASKSSRKGRPGASASASGFDRRRSEFLDNPEDPTTEVTRHPRTVGHPRAHTESPVAAPPATPNAAARAPSRPQAAARSGAVRSGAGSQSDSRPGSELDRAYALLDAEQPKKARDIFKLASVRNPGDRRARIGLELSEGLVALAERDRLEAAQRFEVVLELDPNNDRAAKILADMRRQATAERKNHMARLLGQK